MIEQIAPYRITYPVVFDWERQNYAGSRTQTIPDTGLLCSMANAFCADIEAAGYEAMIYFYQNLAYNNLDLSQLLDYPFWLAQYTDYPSFYYDFDMWQYNLQREGARNLRQCGPESAVLPGWGTPAGGQRRC